MRSKPSASTSRANCRSRRPEFVPAVQLWAAGTGNSVASVLLMPSDQAKLLLAVAGMIARDRLERGVKLNQPEAVALLSCWVIERAREGRSVADLMTEGRSVLTREQVMEGVPELVDEVQVEATFPDGRKLVTLHEPIA